MLGLSWANWSVEYASDFYLFFFSLRKSNDVNLLKGNSLQAMFSKKKRNNNTNQIRNLLSAPEKALYVRSLPPADD